MTDYEKQLAHLTALAMTPGWWQYARHRCRQLEAVFPGIAADVASAVRAADFQPAEAEALPWWK